MTNDYAPLPYDNELTDDSPQLAVVMSQSWWSYVRGACDRLLSVDVWDTSGDVDGAVLQAIDAMARMTGVEPMTLYAYSDHVWLDVLSCKYESAGGKTLSIDASQAHNHYYYQTTPVANEDILSFVVPLAAGQWELKVLTIKSSNSGKFRWWLDGSLAEAPDITDLYNAGNVNNVVATALVTVAESGVHTLKIKNDGKNASASNYYMAITGIALWRNDA